MLKHFLACWMFPSWINAWPLNETTEKRSTIQITALQKGSSGFVDFHAKALHDVYNFPKCGIQQNILIHWIQYIEYLLIYKFCIQYRLYIYKIHRIYWIHWTFTLQGAEPPCFLSAPLGRFCVPCFSHLLKGIMLFASFYNGIWVCYEHTKHNITLMLIKLQIQNLNSVRFLRPYMKT